MLPFNRPGVSERTKQTIGPDRRGATESEAVDSTSLELPVKDRESPASPSGAEKHIRVACHRDVGSRSMQERRKNWVNIAFLALTPVIGIAGTLAYAVAFGIRWWEPALFLVLFG